MLGILNHNWTNIKQNGWSREHPEKGWEDPWKGSGQAYPHAYTDSPGGVTGWAIYDSQGHALFQYPIWCIRATCRQLFKYHQAGARTVEDFIRMWAPEADGNRPDEYAQALHGFQADVDNPPLLRGIGTAYMLFRDDGRPHWSSPDQLAVLIQRMCKMELWAGFSADWTILTNGIALYVHDFCK